MAGMTPAEVYKSYLRPLDPDVLRHVSGTAHISVEAARRLNPLAGLDLSNLVGVPVLPPVMLPVQEASDPTAPSSRAGAGQEQQEHAEDPVLLLASSALATQLATGVILGGVAASSPDREAFMQRARAAVASFAERLVAPDGLALSEEQATATRRVLDAIFAVAERIV